MPGHLSPITQPRRRVPVLVPLGYDAQSPVICTRGLEIIPSSLGPCMGSSKVRISFLFFVGGAYVSQDIKVLTERVLYPRTITAWQTLAKKVC